MGQNRLCCQNTYQCEFLTIIEIRDHIVFVWGFNQVSWYRILCLRQNSVIHLKSKLRDDFEIYAISLTLKISFNSLSNLEIKNIFKICRPSWFQNCPWLFHLIKNWMRCLRLKRRHKQEWSSMEFYGVKLVLCLDGLECLDSI